MLVRCIVESVRINLANNSRVVILKDSKIERYLLIWIGETESYAIASELQGAHYERPLTHDLLYTIIGRLGRWVDFDDDYEISFKVETHNHPSAIEPFGGANTGVGGVIRDILGVSARPIALTDILCFGPPDLAPEALPDGVLQKMYHENAARLVPGIGERLERLVAAVRGIARCKNVGLVGTTHEVLVEGRAKRGDLLQGRTRTNKVALFAGPDAWVGSYRMVRLTGTTGSTFAALPVGQELAVMG